jgi:hypothetical protein
MATDVSDMAVMVAGMMVAREEEVEEPGGRWRGESKA